MLSQNKFNQILEMVWKDKQIQFKVKMNNVILTIIYRKYL